MGGGAVATIGFFFFDVPASYAGAGAFALAAIGMVAGSLLVKRSRPHRRRLRMYTRFEECCPPRCSWRRSGAPPERVRRIAGLLRSRSGRRPSRGHPLGLLGVERGTEHELDDGRRTRAGGWRSTGSRRTPTPFAQATPFVLHPRRRKRDPPRRHARDGGADAWSISPRTRRRRGCRSGAPERRSPSGSKTMRGRLRVSWRRDLRDGSNYVREELALRPATRDVPLGEVQARRLDARPTPASSGR